MTRAILSVASAIIALTSVVHAANVTKVDAKADAQIYLYPFNSDSCYGSPVGSPLELRQGECVSFNGARSVKAMFRPGHSGWVDEVNEFRTHCKLETFRAPGCPSSDETLHSSANMPGDLERCLTSVESVDIYPLYSARFVCGKVENPELLCTSTLRHTSFSVDRTGKLHQSVRTATYTGTLTAPSRVARSVAVNKPEPTLEERFKPGRETKGVWMLHPWSKSVVCYTCYPKKEFDYRKIECRHGIAYTALCSARPVDENGEPTTSRTTTTATTTATTTTHATFITYTTRNDDDAGDGAGTTDDGSSSDSSSDEETEVGLTQRRSWHTPVKFGHPFVEGQNLCADAEWEKRGRPESYIKIQHCHICTDKDRIDSQWIGLPEPVTSVMSATTTTTNTIKHTTTTTFRNRSTSQAHDQL